MSSRDEQLADLKRRIVEFMSEPWAYSLEKLVKGEDRFTYARLRRHFEADGSLLAQAIDALIDDGVLEELESGTDRWYELIDE